MARSVPPSMDDGDSVGVMLPACQPCGPSAGSRVPDGSLAQEAAQIPLVVHLSAPPTVRPDALVSLDTDTGPSTTRTFIPIASSGESFREFVPVRGADRTRRPSATTVTIVSR